VIPGAPTKGCDETIARIAAEAPELETSTCRVVVGLNRGEERLR
jgi:hypothetical protein